MSTVDALAAGTVLHNRYRIVRWIGRGGMGVVYEARDITLDSTVAVKHLTAAGTDANRAFEYEAKILAALRHPSLPVVIDFFVESSGRFLVMQFIEGDDLAKLLARNGGPCAFDDVREWAISVLGALVYLHGHQPPVIHRDIKPSNLRRTPRGEIFLLDFGLAKSASDDSDRTVERSVYGFTPRYAPPEQLDGEVTDARSDLYALGATLYHLATGVPPTSARERNAAVRIGRADPVVPAHVVDPRVPEPFGLTLARAMALTSAERFASATHMRSALVDGRADGLLPRPLPAVNENARRIDAAMPRETEVGRQTDLLVQVRFVGSPLLGIEDWPTRRRPDEVEQASESVRLTYPVEPSSGRVLPARVFVKVVAPDFRIAGRAKQQIEVPPGAYSKRVSFLLTPQHIGACRVNVEIHSPDALYLGCIALEADVSGRPVPEPEFRVAHAVLEALAQQLRDVLTPYPGPPPAAVAAGSGASASIPDAAMPMTQSPAIEGHVHRHEGRRPAASAASGARGYNDLPASVPRSPLVRWGMLTLPVVAIAVISASLFLRTMYYSAPTPPASIVPPAEAPPVPAGDAPPASAPPAPAVAIPTVPDPPVAGRPTPPPTPNPDAPETVTAGTSPTSSAAALAAAKKREASPLSVAPRPNESASERATREKNARYLLDDGKKAFDERRFAEAIDLLQRALDVSERPDFGATPGEAASVIKLARTAKANADTAAARAAAQKLFDQAKALAATDIVGAAKRLRDAQQTDAKVPGIAELMASLQEQAVTQGEAAFTSAKNFDRFKRIPEAIREYDRAVQLLELVPGGHKDLALAKERAAQLKRER